MQLLKKIFGRKSKMAPIAKELYLAETLETEDSVSWAAYHLFDDRPYLSVYNDYRNRCLSESDKKEILCRLLAHDRNKLLADTNKGKETDIKSKKFWEVVQLEEILKNKYKCGN